MSEQQVMKIMLDDIVPILLPIIGDSQALSTNSPTHNMQRYKQRMQDRSSWAVAAPTAGDWGHSEPFQISEQPDEYYKAHLNSGNVCKIRNGACTSTIDATYLSPDASMLPANCHERAPAYEYISVHGTIVSLFCIKYRSIHSHCILS